MNKYIKYLEGFKMCVGVTFGDVVLWWPWLCWVNCPSFADLQGWLKVIWPSGHLLCCQISPCSHSECHHSLVLSLFSRVWILRQKEAGMGSSPLDNPKKWKGAGFVPKWIIPEHKKRANKQE